MTEAFKDNAHFAVVAGVEIEPDYADEWQRRVPEALLIQSGIHSLHSSELPEFDMLVGGIPCTSHSNLGRAKKALAGRPEAGDTGGLFLPVLELVAERMPATVVFENVPGFGTILAGELFVAHLKRIGYHVFTTILQPNNEWGEIEDRKRWLLVATLAKPFSLTAPREACVTPVSAFLDPPNAVRDRLDAERIAKTIEGLRNTTRDTKLWGTVSVSPSSMAARRVCRRFPSRITRSTPARLFKPILGRDCCASMSLNEFTRVSSRPNITRPLCKSLVKAFRPHFSEGFSLNWTIISPRGETGDDPHPKCKTRTRSCHAITPTLQNHWQL